MITLKKQLDMSKYIQLIVLLKRKSDGFELEILTRENISKFLKEADDDQFLLLKVNVI